MRSEQAGAPRQDDSTCGSYLQARQLSKMGACVRARGRFSRKISKTAACVRVLPPFFASRRRHQRNRFASRSAGNLLTCGNSAYGRPRAPPNSAQIQKILRSGAFALTQPPLLDKTSSKTRFLLTQVLVLDNATKRDTAARRRCRGFAQDRHSSGRAPLAIIQANPICGRSTPPRHPDPHACR